MTEKHISTTALRHQPSGTQAPSRSVQSLLAVMLLFVGGCAVQKPMGNPLERVLASSHPAIKRVMDDLEAHEVQIRYTQIDRKDQDVLFTDYDFQVDANDYFYPASTVKFPIAVLALEKLNETDSLGIDTRFYVEGDTVETTFRKALSEIFAVSDNEANNRLVEFLGQDAINRGLKEKGIEKVRIAHRLGQHSDDVATKPLVIYQNDSTTVLSEPIINTPAQPLDLHRIKKGRAYYEEDSLYAGPFDFSLKNYYPIEAQSAVLKRVIFPQAFPQEERFQLGEDLDKVLRDAMHTVPRKAGYDPEEYYDGYCKFFLFGDTREPIPDTIEIYNKVGFAYGTLTDCAYIKDVGNQVEFMLTATVLVNSDGVFNDNAYEYDEIGIPFLAELGRQLHDLELKRKRE